MKLIIFPSVAVMVVMVTLVVRKEIGKRSLNIQVQERNVLISGKEKVIADLKNTVGEVKSQLEAIMKKTEDLKKQKKNLIDEKKRLEDGLVTCQKETGESETVGNEATEKLNKQKSEHEQAKQAAQTTIQDLKQKILDREKAICALIDTTNAEAKKLCGLPDAPQ